MTPIMTVIVVLSVYSVGFLVGKWYGKEEVLNKVSKKYGYPKEKVRRNL